MHAQIRGHLASSRRVREAVEPFDDVAAGECGTGAKTAFRITSADSLLRPASD